VLIVSFLYMHFTNGSGLTRIYIAGAIVLAAILILLPSLNVELPDWFKAGFGATKIQLGLDLQGGNPSADGGKARRGGENPTAPPRG